MPDVRLELNSAGMAALLKSPGVASDLRRRAQRVAANAGHGFDRATTTTALGVEATSSGKRAAARVWTATRRAKQAEATDRALTRAFDAARG